jgi:hypothetical protein
MSVRSSLRNVALMLFSIGASLPTAAIAQERLWLDVNLGYAVPTDQDFSTHLTRTIADEPADFDVDYSAPAGVIFDAGAGFLLTPRFGVGVSISQSRHSDVPVLSARVPHPFLFNQFGSDTVEGDTELERTETGVHVQAVFVPFQGDTSRLRVFIGPTWMRVKNETVLDFDYTQAFTTAPPSNRIAITGYDISACECSGWGFNVGADYSYFFTPTIGVGGVLRYTRATVEPVDFSGPFELTAGGVAVGGGLRVKF